MTRKENEQARRAGWRLLPLAALMLLAWITVVRAQNDICFTNIGGLGGAPTIDGIVEGFTTGPVFTDPGWNNATRINLSGDNGSTTATKFMAGKNGGFVYFAFVVNWASLTANNADTIVIALSTIPGDSTKDWRIHIKPFDTGVPASGTSNIVPKVTYWRNSGPSGNDWNQATPSPLPVVTAPGFWMKDDTRASLDGLLWAVEMKIPIATAAGQDFATPTGIFFPPTGPFELYLNVLSTDNLSGSVSQSEWPEGMNIAPGASNLLTRNTPPRPWGTASLNDRPECTGVTLSWSDIGVVNPDPPGDIIQTMKRHPGPFAEVDMAACAAHPEGHLFPGTKGPPNTFIAKPFNGMATNKPINVTFYIANWGMPGSGTGIPGTTMWGKIGMVNGGLDPPVGVTPANPTAEQTITAGTADKNFTATWELSYRWSCLYSFREHQCIRVDLDSSDPSTVIKNKSVEKNMNFVPASTFQQKAYISGNQGPLPAGRSKHQFVILVETDEQGPVSPPRGNTSRVSTQSRSRRLHSDEIAALATQHFRRRPTNLGVWIARGFFKTGKTLNIDGREYEIVDRAGDFGYVAGHSGEIEGWRFGFTGTGLNKLSEGVYTIEVAPGEEAEVLTVIEAVEAGGITPPPGEFKRWGLSLHAGASIPHGNFNTLFNPGPNAGIDLEYRINPNFSMEGIYTFHRFRGDTFGSVTIGDLNVHQFSINGKVYGSSSPWRPFFNFGGGAYKFDPGTTRAGLNAGFGVQRDITPTFEIHAMYNLHNVFTSGSSTKFSTVQGGVRFRF